MAWTSKCHKPKFSSADHKPSHAIVVWWKKHYKHKVNVAKPDCGNQMKRTTLTNIRQNIFSFV